MVSVNTSSSSNTPWLISVIYLRFYIIRDRCFPEPFQKCCTTKLVRSGTKNRGFFTPKAVQHLQGIPKFPVMPVPPWQHCCYCPLLPHFYLDILLILSQGHFISHRRKKKKNYCVYLARCLHSYGLLKAEINLAMITVLPNHRDLHRFSITREQEDIRVLKQ